MIEQFHRLIVYSTEQNAHIVLAPCKDCDGIEIVLGFRGDTVTVMREKKKKPTVAVDENVGFICCKNYLQLWKG